MRTKICRRLSCEVPIFAFSHCRDVVVEVTKAGGFGVLGSSMFSPDELEYELNWIDGHVGDRSYGVDVLMSRKYDVEAAEASGALIARVPDGHKRFVQAFLDHEGVPDLPADLQAEIDRGRLARERNVTPDAALKMIDVTVRHPKVKLVVSALGAPSRDVADDLKSRGILVGGLCGKPAHVRHHRDAGVDLIIAQGSEAGGHSGTISTMVLAPQIVDECGSDMAVLVAGGISRGSQILAALAMGAQGVWCGSIWLGTRESDLLPYQKEAIFEASSEDTLQSRAMTGKPVRMLNSRYVEAWAGPTSPGALRPPLQKVLYMMTRDRIDRARRKDLFSYPAGQVIGTMQRETTVRDVMYALQSEYVEASQALAVTAGLVD